MAEKDASRIPPLPPQVRASMLYGEGKVDRSLAIQWLEGHWKGERQCPICQASAWGVGDDLLRLWTSKHVPSYPCIVVVCNNCGYTMLFNAVRMGLLPEGKT